MLKSILMLAILAAPQLHADSYNIVLRPTSDRSLIGGDPLTINLQGSFQTDGACSICTILDFYNQGEHLTIEGLPEIQFGRLGGVWLGVGSSGLLGGAGYANVTFDRTQHVLFGYIEGGADFIRLNADRTYAVLFAGVQSEAGTFSIPGVPEPLPEPSAIVLLMSALVIAIPALRRRYK